MCKVAILPSTATSTLSISPRHLREVTDPISLLLSQLHKLIFISQLPPSHTPSARRTLVEQYKRNLFDKNSNPSDLKSELHKLSSGVGEPVQLLVECGVGQRLVQHCHDELRSVSQDREAYQVGVADREITYEQLQAIIESLVMENSYYQTNYIT